MTNPMDFPDFPLGLTLRDHMVGYLGALAANVEEMKEAGAPAELVGIARACYEDLAELVEFHIREMEFNGGGDRLKIFASMDGTRTTISIDRDGNTLAEFPLSRNALVEFMGGLTTALEAMTDGS